MKLLIVVTTIILTIGCATPNYYLGMDYNTFHQNNTDNINFIIESKPSHTGAFVGTYNWKNGKRVKIGWSTDQYGIPRIGGYTVYDSNNNVINRVR